MGIDWDSVLKAIGGRELGPAAGDSPIHKISTDTRTLQKGDLFVALQGGRFDGHDFIEEALERGADHFVVSNAKKIREVYKKRAHFAGVDDTLKAYGDLARFYRAKFKIPAVAITGSCGKTTVKELLAHLLTGHLKVLKNRGTENNLVGVPKTIFQLDAMHEAIVLEMGTSNPGEIETLSSILRPQIGILTQVGHAHLEGLKSLEGVLDEKLKMMRHLERGGHLILNGENPYLAAVQSGVHRVLRVGFDSKYDFVPRRIVEHQTGSSFYLNGNSFETQLVGQHNVLNCLLAIAAATVLGAPPALLQKNLASFKPVPGRFCLREIDGIHFIDDTYNSNPVSFRAAVETLKNFSASGKKGIVCGDMLELGASAEEMHRQMGAVVASFFPDFIVACGVSSKYLVETALQNGYDASRITHVMNSAEAGQVCRKIISPGDLVLVKGSRGMQMEKIFECFITSSIL